MLTKSVTKALFVTYFAPMPNIILETERLLLRKPTTDDAAFMLRLVNEPSWLQYIGDRNVHTLQEAEQYLLNGSIKSFETIGFGFGIVLLKDSLVPIGMCGFVKRDFLEHPDLGFAFFPEYTRMGYAFEVASATLMYGKTYLGMKDVAAITTHDNLSSINLLQKLNFENKGTVMVGEEELLLWLYREM